MKQELSAGAVILRSTEHSWDVLLIRDMKGLLTFPKGFIEDGEDAKTTAIREAAEETGIHDLTYLSELPDVSYFYTRNGQSVHKKVQYFLFISKKNEELRPQIEEGITEIIWMPLEKAMTVIGYEKSNSPLLRAAHEYSTHHQEHLHP